MSKVEYASVVRKTEDGRVVEVKPKSGSTKLLNLDGLGIDPLTDANPGDSVRLISNLKGKVVNIERI